MPLQLEDYLPNLDDTPMAAEGRPLLLPLDVIDEDPCQPRSEFDVETLSDLAKTIAARGVLQPVSVRSHPEQAGRWMLNFGARRCALRGWRARPRSQPSFANRPTRTSR
jgi:ParB family chromosome partitioning protein